MKDLDVEEDEDKVDEGGKNLDIGKQKKVM